jgi:rhodanese-related sulfurtransferase
MTKNQNLNNISILFFSFVAIIVIINLFTTNNYGRSNSEVVKMLDATEYIFNYQELHATLNSNEYLLIDLRTEEEFNAGHIPGAINIPFDQLLDSRNIRTIRRSHEKTPVLYAGTEARAQTARMLLLAKGLKTDIRVMGGNYDTAVKYVLETFQPAFAAYKDEKARFDYRRFMQASPTGHPERQREQPAGIIPALNQQQTTAVAGGC